MKNMIKAALVLEGGALRGMYTSGVLDTFLEHNMEFECVVGVSAGALNGMNYISKQKGRSARINLEYCNNPKYIGRKAILKNKGIIGYDYLFGDISKIGNG
ncbi:MAG TPA: patatin-like phospholipase family protein [Candidatus Merdicola faecigallinarum]|uniref:Patatin-like phospholipase family protein n=1 Tax=Candidatus Merdicola faecigallinarum TaxID=2840862 RepID=A0A9D1S9M0_9FIRM|nr:patatin-like phospholipase family protein [Candidatus Merdicola faecigallinarum]